MRFLIGLIIESSVFLLQPGQESEVKELKDLFAAGYTIMEGGILTNQYKNQVWENWNITNVVDLSNDIYDLDEEELVTMKEYARLLNIKEKDDNKL